ncbi:uncharacterized protein LOC115739562 [Rhodamnia argentea]|uniref:Uncharacterized protein LOC115739562 n=1 Tax=Rhodamnia argentea TaxID=178133 RepID=A0A8B8P1C6_9MYRT|nr:uncharacterized protein LOC115739562 [Rhodamnia argentea]
MSSKSFDSASLLEPIPIDASLTLVPRVRVTLTVHPTNHSHTKPVDDWQLKKALLDFLKSSLAVSLSVPDGDLEIRRVKDVRKRRRDDPVAHGTLVIRDLGFLKSSRGSYAEESGEDAARALEEKYADWKRYLVEKMNGMDLVLGGVKFMLGVEMPVSDSFQAMRKEWEEFHAFGNRGHSRGRRQEPDTIVLRGVPSRWFAEPRVSSKPSMLVTHTIFSTFGSIRNISVADDDDFGRESDEDPDGLVSGLHCKIVVQFEKHEDFHNAMKALCGRSLEKQGSRLRADYEVSWDKDGLFRNSRSETQEKSSGMTSLASGPYRSEFPKFSRYSPEKTRPKRFRE